MRQLTTENSSMVPLVWSESFYLSESTCSYLSSTPPTVAGAFGHFLHDIRLTNT